MTTTHNSVASDEKPSDLQREVRLGLVMYGGVSLAVYINGVAREFFRAVRGAGVYRFVKALTDSDVVVDVISGTSAGGINGIMLAYALCNRKEFASTANLWRLDGDIRSLLRSPHGDLDSTESLFNSEGYYQLRLEAAFRDMADYVPEEGELESRFPELDLFITGTDVDGRISTQFDDAGHPIDVKDHRSVFLLKHRAGRKLPFSPSAGPSPETTFQALAKLSRITSCFPAAFAPVHVAGDAPCDDTVDGKLQSWGDLGKEATFLDGGVIDNKPFTYTIREIFNRVADREVERKLFYVEPDPESFEKQDIATQPNFVQAVIASLIGIPGYESIADDLKLLAAHNSKVKLYQRFRDYLEWKTQRDQLPDREQMSDTEKNLFDREKELYERCGLIAISERVVRGILKEDGRDKLLGPNEQRAARALIDTFDEVQKEMQKVKSTTDEPESSRKRAPAILRNFDIYYRMRRLHRTVYKIAEVLRDKNVKSADLAEVNRYTNLWRLLNREIELLEIIRFHMERLIDQAPVSWKAEIIGAKHRGEVVEEAKLLWAALNVSLERLMGLQDDEELAQLLATKPNYKNPEQLLTDAFQSIHQQMAAADLGAVRLEGFDRQTLSQLNKSLRLRADAIIPLIDQTRAQLRSLQSRKEKSKERKRRAEASQEFSGLLMRTSEFERGVIRAVLKNPADPDEEAVRCAYFHFENVDTKLFPIELVSELYEKDIIETIRISPRDAEKGFSKRSLADKVSGDALYHFGGFFKRSWRSNDILWGRLDSLCQLVEMLLDPERIGRVLKNPAQAERVRGRFFKNRPDGSNSHEWADGMHPENLFPNAGAKTHKELAGWLVELLWNDPALAPKVLKEKHDRSLAVEVFSVKLERVIEAAQLEILHEEVPNVVTDALEEQARWNQFRFPRLEPKPRAAPKPRGRRRWLLFGERAEAAPAGGGGAAAQKRPEESNPFVYTPAEGHLDPFVSVVAAAGAAHDVMRRFKHSTGNPNPETPKKTDLGRFFTDAYRIGSEALLRDMPLLVLFEILSVSLLVLRNCVLKLFGESAARIKSHPFYVVLIDFPLRAFHTLVIFMRRVPASKKWLPIALFFLSLLLLIIGVGWRDSIVWVTKYETGVGVVTEFYLRWFLLFIAGPLVVLFAQGVYLYQGKVNDWSWLRGLRNVLIGFFLLSSMFFVVIAYAGLFEATKSSLMRRGAYVWELGGMYLALLPGAGYVSGPVSKLASALPWEELAGYAVNAVFLLTLLGPLLAFKALSWLKGGQRADADKLRELLRQYFSIQEMLVIARRLQLFDATEMEDLASGIGYLSEEDFESFSHSTGLKRRLFESLSTEEKKRITLDQMLTALPKAEQEEKQQAYAGLQQALAAAEARPDKESPADEGAIRAADKFYREMREIEDEKARLVEELVENTKRSEKKKAAAAGEALAERIVSKAVQIDRERREQGAEPRDGRGGKLVQLEEMMSSINPEALR